MRFIYNSLQLLLVFICWPLLLAVFLCKDKYRKSVPKRLGFGLPRSSDTYTQGKKVIWIHALSVGEVTSALPLVLGIRSEFDNIHIVFSATTRTGSQLAENSISQYVDQIIPFPLDILPVVSYFLNTIQPDLFVLVETDFWPNILTKLKSDGTPAILVNGRISQKSMHSYKRFSYFFKPLFQSFTHLCMQTATDKESMIDLGIDKEKILTLGNLKFDTPLPDTHLTEHSQISLPEDYITIIAGSTHKGEEEIILKAFSRLKQDHRVFLVIAPRDISRTKEIEELVISMGLSASSRSDLGDTYEDVLLLDTLGELFSLYMHADIAFVGGSIVAEGGHNPIEPAILGVPVIFGPHMEDFSEVSNGLIDAGGAFSVSNTEDLYTTFRRFAIDREFRSGSGQAALKFVREQQGVISRHINLIRKLL